MNSSFIHTEITSSTLEGSMYFLFYLLIRSQCDCLDKPARLFRPNVQLPRHHTYYRYNGRHVLHYIILPNNTFSNNSRLSVSVDLLVRYHMMTSSNGNIFRVTGHLCGEFTGEFPAQRPVTRGFDVFFDPRLNKRLSKQSWGWWFETSSRTLWLYVTLMTWICHVFVSHCFWLYTQFVISKTTM